jgi:pyruvate dehydrogenase E2 component (dihydrolipoamide acetyltransferase)
MFEFKLPDLGEGVHEGQIVSVLVKEGDTINEYQPMLEVETDKAAVEIPAPKSGTVARLLVQPGQQVKVGQVLVVIDDSVTAAGPAAESAMSAAAAGPAKAAASGAAAAPRPAPASTMVEASPARAPAPVAATAAAPAAREGPVPAAPAVRKLARELSVDLHQVHGTGPGGRVLREDVERFALSRRGGTVAAERPSPAGPRLEPPPDALPDFSQYGPIRREQPPQIRRTIARQMTRAWANVPRVTHGEEADITELERNRKAYNAGLAEGQPKLTITAIVMKAVAGALRRYPMLNCSYDAANEEIIYKDYVHIGVAVDTPRGLVVPVLRDADRKPLPQIAAELSDLAERARTARFEIAELRGATFTITNVGALGGTFSTPMVNFPEVAILGLARSSWQPRVLENMQIVPRLILPMSLSFDHRVVDGADAARFTREVVGALENPLRLICM